MINWKKVAILLLIAMAVDRVLAIAANSRILARNADFDVNYAEVQIDWGGEYIQHCRYRRELYVYKYKTCLFVRSSSKDKGKWGAIYVYHSPLAIFAPTHVIPTSSYYFQELQYGKRMFVVRYNSEIEKIEN